MSLVTERESLTFARFHRLRRTPALRRLVRETRLDPAMLVLPVFVDARVDDPSPIAALPGHARVPIRKVGDLAARAADAGIGAVLLFGVPESKDKRGTAAADPLGPVPSAIPAILAYAAKYASSLYGPFRDAADCAPAFGDRKAYQLDPPNRREALAELAADVAEGADALMVKPAGPYLDVIAAPRARFDLPIAAYQVSGEYSALHAAAQRGWLDLRRAALESLTAIARAGAGIVVTYFALEAAEWLRQR